MDLLESGLIDRLRFRIDEYQTEASDRFIYVDVHDQKLYLISGIKPEKVFTISTARKGMGSGEGSEKTPPGIHRIIEKIGEGAPIGRIFKDRQDTGSDWHPGLTGDNLILTRILRLEGLENGINRGPGIDSFSRYIYIHGTNQEHALGTPISHGCVCMRNSEIIQLFDSVEEGTLVIID
jgi:UDP-N-acetylmuramate--alanine ligase